MKILYFHSTIWSGFFASLLGAYAGQRGARTAIVCPRRFRQPYAANFAAGAEPVDFPDTDAPQDWERDPGEVARVAALVAECERASGRALGRFLLACERDIGAGYSLGAFYWPALEPRASCLADTALPGRIALRVFRFVEQLFERFQPDLVLARAFNAPLEFAARMLAVRAGVPMLCCQFSKAIGKRAFWTDDYLMYNTPGRELFAQYTAQGRPASDFAAGFLDEFRTRPRTVDYIAANWARTSDWATEHRKFLALAKAGVLHRLGGGQGKAPMAVLPKVWEYYRVLLAQRWHAGRFATFGEDALAAMPYVYYPLHKEPELMLNYKAPLWHDQLHAIRFLSSMLPSGLRLLVREHRFNWGRRTGAFLDALAAIPNVTLVHPLDPQFKYIRHAELVVTDNGSTGWEGLLLGRRVLALEPCFYDVLPGLHRAPDPRELDRVILDALAAPAVGDASGHDQALGRFLDAERATTLDIEAMQGDLAPTMARIDELLSLRRAS